MSNIPAELRYTRSHEWVRSLESGQIEMGITDHAQATLGDLVFVELPLVGRRVTAGEPCAVVESVKAASDVYSPVDGKVSASNAALTDTPELLNQAPYGNGWLIRVELDAAMVVSLLTADEYAKFLAEQVRS